MSSSVVQEIAKKAIAKLGEKVRLDERTNATLEQVTNGAEIKIRVYLDFGDGEKDELSDFIANVVITDRDLMAIVKDGKVETTSENIAIAIYKQLTTEEA